MKAGRIDNVHLFGAKAVFEHKGRLGNPSNLHYEERVVMIQAVDFAAATEEAEIEAEAYAASISGCRYLGYVNVYKTNVKSFAEFESNPEAFSLMRASTLEPDEFLRKYYIDS